MKHQMKKNSGRDLKFRFEQSEQEKNILQGQLESERVFTSTKSCRRN